MSTWTETALKKLFRQKVKVVAGGPTNKTRGTGMLSVLDALAEAIAQAGGAVTAATLVDAQALPVADPPAVGAGTLYAITGNWNATGTDGTVYTFGLSASTFNVSGALLQADGTIAPVSVNVAAGTYVLQDYVSRQQFLTALGLKLDASKLPNWGYGLSYNVTANTLNAYQTPLPFNLATAENKRRYNPAQANVSNAIAGYTYLGRLKLPAGVVLWNVNNVDLTYAGYQLDGPVPAGFPGPAFVNMDATGTYSQVPSVAGTASVYLAVSVRTSDLPNLLLVPTDKYNDAGVVKRLAALEALGGRFRGAFTTGATYLKNDWIYQAGAIQYALADFSAIGAFDQTNWGSIALGGGSGSSYDDTAIKQRLGATTAADPAAPLSALTPFVRFTGSASSPMSVVPGTVYYKQGRAFKWVGAAGKVPVMDDAIEGWQLVAGQIAAYSDLSNFPAEGYFLTLYLDLNAYSLYMWTGVQYVPINGGLGAGASALNDDHYTASAAGAQPVITKAGATKFFNVTVEGVELTRGTEYTDDGQGNLTILGAAQVQVGNVVQYCYLTGSVSAAPAQPSTGNSIDYANEVEYSAATTLTASSAYKSIVLAGGSDFTLTLPAASSMTGKLLAVRVRSSATAVFFITPQGSDTINLEGPFPMWAQESMVLLAGTGGWVKISTRLRAMYASATLDPAAGTLTMPALGYQYSNRLPLSYETEAGTPGMHNKQDGTLVVRRSGRYQVNLRARVDFSSTNATLETILFVNGAISQEFLTSPTVPRPDDFAALIAGSAPLLLKAGDVVAFCPYSSAASGSVYNNRNNSPSHIATLILTELS